MRIVLLGSLPSYYYRRELGIESSKVGRITSWNHNLVYGLRDYTDLDEIHFVTTAKEIRELKQIRKGKLTVHFYPVKKGLNAVTLFQYDVCRFRKLVRQLGPDVVHGIGTEHIYPYVALKSGYPSIITIHGIINDYLGYSLRDHLTFRGIVLGVFERLVMSMSTNIISINPYVCQRVRAFSSNSRHYFDIANCVSSKAFKLTSRERRDILFVGTSEKRKGLDDLLIAMKKILRYKPHAHLRIVIPQDSRSLKLKLFANKLNLLGSVTFYHELSNSQILRMMSDAAALVVPSHKETAPMVISEAMSTGTVVIAYDVCGIHYMIENGITGFLIPEGNIEQLSNAIVNVLERPDLRKQVGANARNKACCLFLPEVVAKKTYLAYESVSR